MKKLSYILIILAMAVGVMLGCKNDPTPQPLPPNNIEIVDDTPQSITLDDLRDTDKVNLSATFTINPNVPEQNPSSNALRANNVFGSGMVLQQKCVNKLYGTTSASVVAVEYRDVISYGTVSDGKWQVYLPAYNAVNQGFKLIIYTDSARVSLLDVYTGEVFLCGGQSNMDYLLGSMPEHKDDVNKANDKMIRMLTPNKIIEKDYVTAPIEELKSCPWRPAVTGEVEHFSAVGYMFGLRMRQKLNVPIGLIALGIGGSGIAYWLPESAYAKALENGYDIYTDESVTKPSKGYNGMVNPVKQYKARGVIWYQGETDAMYSYAKHYDKLLQLLIQSWRTEFNQPEMLFTLYGLPRYSQHIQGYGDVREGQQKAAKALKNVCVSTNIDLGTWDDIHPPNKTEYSNRAADTTLFNYYGIESPRPPVIVNHEINGNTLTITMKNVGDGIKVINNGAGFEVVNTSDVTNGNGITVTVVDKNTVQVKFISDIKTISYAVKPLVSVASTFDVSKQISIFNSHSLPLDQFIFKTK